MRNVKITRVDVFKVIVPMKPDTVHSEGVEDPLCKPDPTSGRRLNFYEFPKFILRLHASNGATGLGEPVRGDHDDLIRQSADLLIGKSLSECPPGNLPIPRNVVYEGFDMAYYDLVGNTLGVPVWLLLGGKCRDRVQVDYWLGRCTPEETARRTGTARELGFRGVKFKCILEDPVAERVQAIKSAAPDMTVVLDPNERFYHPEGAEQVARQLRDFTGVTFESPVPQERLDWYVHLRQKLDISIALHLTDLQQLLAALRQDAADYYNLLGTMKEFVEMSRVADAAGCPTWRGTGMDLGVRDVSSVHAAAAAPGCTLPSDIVGNFMREDDLIVEPIRFENGYAVVPDGAGLGVELDEDAVDKYLVGEWTQ